MEPSPKPRALSVKRVMQLGQVDLDSFHIYPAPVLSIRSRQHRVSGSWTLWKEQGVLSGDQRYHFKAGTDILCGAAESRLRIMMGVTETSFHLTQGFLCVGSWWYRFITGLSRYRLYPLSSSFCYSLCRTSCCCDGVLFPLCFLGHQVRSKHWNPQSLSHLIRSFHVFSFLKCKLESQ